jgi:hypothetical protein
MSSPGSTVQGSAVSQPSISPVEMADGDRAGLQGRPSLQESSTLAIVSAADSK